MNGVKIFFEQADGTGIPVHSLVTVVRKFWRFSFGSFFWIKSKSSIQKGIEDIFKYLPFWIDDLQLLHYLQRNFLNNQSFFNRF